MRRLVAIISIWVGLFCLTSLDQALTDGSTARRDPGGHQKPPPAPTPIITMTTVLGGFGYFLTREILGEERGGTKRKPVRTLLRQAVRSLGVRGWQVGVLCAMGSGWVMQGILFSDALKTSGWSKRPIMLGLLGVVLVGYAVLTLIWGIRYIQIVNRRNLAAGKKPVSPVGVWDSDLDHEFAPGSRPVQ